MALESSLVTRSGRRHDTKLFRRFGTRLSETVTRVKDGENNNRDGNHTKRTSISGSHGAFVGAEQDLHRLQHDELGLLPHDRVAPSTTELSNSVRATDENACEGDRCSSDEQLEHPARREITGAVVQEVRALAHIPEKVKRQHGEYDQGDDLKGQASNHDINTDIEKILVGSDSGESTTGGLQDDTDNVAGDEDPSVELWSQT